MKEAKTQQEFKELSNLGEWFYVTQGKWAARGSSHVVAWGSSHVVARGNSRVVARESSHVEAWENSRVVARESSYVEAWENSHVEAWESSHVVARESSYVEAWESSHVEAWGDSHVVARGSSYVEAWGSSHVEAWGSSHVVARGNSRVVARESSYVEAWESSHVEAWERSYVEGHSPYTTILAKSAAALLSGGYILGNKILTSKEWLCACSIPIKKGKVVLFKSLNKDWTTLHGVSYKVGEVTIAPDWDASFGSECGRGLHFSPTVAQAKIFREDGIFVACEVAIKDMASLPAFAQYPDKIRARACKVLYQVNDESKKQEKKGEKGK